MKRKPLYSKHQAFDKTYNYLINNQDYDEKEFDAPKKYHHDPDKLNAFKDFSGYIMWSNELHAASTIGIKWLRELYIKTLGINTKLYNSTKPLKEILTILGEFKLDLADLYDDIFELQDCMLATNINEKQAEIGALSDRLNYLTALENNITDLCNSKINEIGSSRVTFTNLSIALAALAISGLSIYYNLHNN